jgi:hypothetical protein
MQMFKEFSDLRHIANFKRIILPNIGRVLHLHLRLGITSPVFSIARMRIPKLVCDVGCAAGFASSMDSYVP